MPFLSLCLDLLASKEEADMPAYDTKDPLNRALGKEARYMLKTSCKCILYTQVSAICIIADWTLLTSIAFQ